MLTLICAPCPFIAFRPSHAPDRIYNAGQRHTSSAFAKVLMLFIKYTVLLWPGPIGRPTNLGEAR